MSHSRRAMPKVVGTPAEVVIGAGSLQSGTLRSIADSGSPQGFLLTATVACRILIGSNPTALATSVYVPANMPMFFEANMTEKVAVIQETGAGKLSVAAVRW